MIREQKIFKNQPKLLKELRVLQQRGRDEEAVFFGEPDHDGDVGESAGLHNLVRIGAEEGASGVGRVVRVRPDGRKRHSLLR